MSTETKSAAVAAATSAFLDSLELVHVAPLEQLTKFTPSPLWLSKGRSGKKRAVIVLHEWWGITDELKAQAASWFSEEFIVGVLDLYRNQTASNVEEAAHLMNGLDFSQALRDIRATVKYLREQIGCTKIGLVGFGLGGCLALAASVHLKDLTASSIFYGIPDSRFASPTKVHIPIQLHFGADDTLPGFSDAKAQDNLEKQLKDNNVQHDFYRYPNCGHAFANVGHTAPEEQQATIKAKERTQQFFLAKLA